MNRGIDPQSRPSERAVQAYREAFGTEPVAGGLAPGRVNLIGDHTDYNGGLALPIALDLHAVAVVGPGTPGQIEIVAADLGERAATAFDPDSIRAISGQPWFAYPAGAAWLTTEVLQNKHPLPGLRLVIASSVPIASGLSSSAAIEVAVVTALEAMFKGSLNPTQKAKLCMRAEHRFAGTPSGLLDPLASILGSPDAAVLIDFDTLEHSKVCIPPGATLAIIDTGTAHSNADGRYARVRERCAAAAALLEVAMLSQADLHKAQAPSSGLSSAELAATEHVLCENARVKAFVEALESESLDTAGQLMNESHRSLSELLQVSTPQIDQLVEAVTKIDGVLGCRMTGGGFGGFLVALIEKPRDAEAILKIERAASISTRPCNSPRLVRPSGGARVINVESL